MSEQTSIEKKIEETKKQLQQLMQEAQQNNAGINQLQERNKQIEGQYNVLVGRLNALQEIAQEGQVAFFPATDPAAAAGEAEAVSGVSERQEVVPGAAEEKAE